MKNIVEKEGFSKLYAGMIPCSIGIFPYAAIDLGLASILKSKVNYFFLQKDK